MTDAGKRHLDDYQCNPAIVKKKKGVTHMIKKLTTMILVCITLSALVCGCAQKTEERTEYIGIVSAMDNESIFCLKKQ